ncbi:MAG TPA: CvpA family protein [Pseudogracilibacillus sp.]|nr:CvpA family protein [Pseudogracilibacillus sp.]
MISILLILILVFGFFMGMKRGFILQLMHLLSFIIAFTVAVLYYKKLAPNLVSWIPYPDITSEQSWAIFLDSMPMENAFYNAIAFALIFFGTKIILQIIASMLDFVARLPVLKQLNKLLGAILGFVEVYLILFVLLYVVALTPVGKLQGYVADSFVARLIVEFTPFLSSAMESLWFTDVLGKLF